MRPVKKIPEPEVIFKERIGGGVFRKQDNVKENSEPVA
jgi:hypothetical protein